MICIDGSQGEGGGQIIRTCLSFSIMNDLKIRIENIRANRSKPGLKNQHLSSVNFFIEMGMLEAKNAIIGAKWIEFHPIKDKKELPDSHVLDIKSGGSITLVLQAVLPVLKYLCKKPFELCVIGGTDVPFSPPIDYFINVLLPRVSSSIYCEIVKRGYMSGDGIVKLLISPPSVLIENGDEMCIKIISNGSGMLSDSRVLERLSEAVKEMLSLKYSMSIKEEIHYDDNVKSNGAGMIILVNQKDEILYSFNLLKLKKNQITFTNEFITKEAIKTVGNIRPDKYFIDQILPFMIMKKSISSIKYSDKLSLHAITNISILKVVAPNAKIDVKDDEKLVNIYNNDVF
jgi:RNA 3'-phosphate cyclase